MILPADKGRATVVMDKEEYEQKVTTMLSEKKTYEQLSADPASKYKRKSVSILTRHKEEGRIPVEKYKSINSSIPLQRNVPRLFCTPKIHKPNAPLRPIVIQPQLVMRLQDG